MTLIEKNERLTKQISCLETPIDWISKRVMNNLNGLGLLRGLLDSVKALDSRVPNSISKRSSKFSEHFSLNTEFQQPP